MKRLLRLLFVYVISFGLNSIAFAQNDENISSTETEKDASISTNESATSEEVDQTSISTNESTTNEEVDQSPDEVEPSFTQQVKDKFIEGGWEFMGIVLICLILGLAIAIERIIVLNLATTNNKKLVRQVQEALESGGIKEAEEVVKSTRGPVASIFAQGLMRISEGIEIVEKSVISYGSVEMGKLEKGLVWISLFISLAPMLGFMGTVIGMIGAFDAIEAAGDISPSLVANGIKVALLTTVAGLIVAIILQLFYNYCVSKIDSIVNGMEDASIALIDVLVKHKLTNK